MSKHSKRREALLYHAKPRPGKIEVVPTKSYSTQRDLSLAYSPGVAEPCLEIEKNVENVHVENSVFESDQGITAIDVDGLVLNNVKVISPKDNALTLYNAKNVTVKDFSYDEDGKSPVRVIGNKSANIKLQKKDFKAAQTQVIKENEVAKNAVSIN